MVIHYITEAVWPSIEVSIDHFAGSRPGNGPTKLTAGINFQIILGAACYLEGILESILRALLEHRRKIFFDSEQLDFAKRKSNNQFFNRLHTDLAARVGRSTGIAGYRETFELVTGYSFDDLSGLKPLLEALSVLFHFRNVLGHGREVAAKRVSRGNSALEDDFGGSYRKVEDYLFKKKLLKHRFVDRHSEYLFLGSDIADHFWGLAKKTPIALVGSLPTVEADVCSKALEIIRLAASPTP
ncbi:hypothetical protein [Granulicella tundricola]|uniref:RiboL-PSP-HEPN domain-containing protein n=1 Tax=Granulicella tundricola (strain ATCC BAA-1859 / DSM 23138 / MP5ACTX9) TaxID=1198114 RepID=E8X177_GRATM|nr:hypothetical protein [Granulicella tundricola]ADW69031.1 hypothetical protein AciX9_1985 [Granulicella tundricola MP5ACTX9]